MGHPKIDNRTPFAVAPTYAADEDGRPLLVVLVQPVYALAAGRPLSLAEEQTPPNLKGEPWGADPAAAGWRVEPMYAFTKLSTDVVLVGHAQAPRAVTELHVSFRVGALGKVLRVVGDRVWTRAGGAIAPGRPSPFERVPLSYERAFGGWDRTSPDPAGHACEARNPVGRGFRAPNAPFQEGIPLPNIEDPAAPLERWGQVVPPAGVGFVSPDWHPRAALAGTYDAAWAKDRSPLLPKNFDRRFFNSASARLVATGYLRGDEPVDIDGASPLGRLAFQLPGVPAPKCRVELTRGGDIDVPLRLDTVIVDTDADRVLLLHRGFAPLRDGPHDVRTIEVS